MQYNKKAEAKKELERKERSCNYCINSTFEQKEINCLGLKKIVETEEKKRNVVNKRKYVGVIKCQF